MKKLLGFVLVAATLAGCATAQQQSLEDQLSPSALVSTQYTRCERDSRVASGTAGQTSPTPGTINRGDVNVTHDINSKVYFNCVKDLPPVR